MKKFWAIPALLALLAAARLVMPAATDAAELLPVTVLQVDTAPAGAVRVTCDAGEDALTGVGATLDDALKNLSDSAPGTLFLQTAEHILITPAARYALPQAANSQRLRPAARVYIVQGGAPKLTTAGDFLRAHGGGARLMDVRAALLGAKDAPRPQTLVCAQGRLALYGG